MAPNKQVAAGRDVAKPGDVEMAEEIATTHDLCGHTAVVQLGYMTARTLWHVALPRCLGEREFVPLAPAVFGAYLFCLLLFWLAGGFGPAPKARGWLLNVYNLLMVLVLGKCATDCYIYNFAPHMWAHHNDKALWGVPAVIMARWPANWPLLGASRTSLQHAIKVVERWADAFLILACFRGIRHGKTLMQLRRAQKRALERKKEK
ncbi:hypothetical protein ACK3TF_006095 [Chlorella vulgaris]